MEEVNKKYYNLKALCNRIDEKNEWIISLQTTHLELFLYTMRLKLAEPNANCGTIYKDIISVSKIDENTVKEEDKTLIKRYIEYFTKISQTIM